MCCKFSWWDKGSAHAGGFYAHQNANKHCFTANMSSVI